MALVVVLKGNRTESKVHRDQALTVFRRGAIFVLADAFRLSESREPALSIMQELRPDCLAVKTPKLMVSPNKQTYVFIGDSVTDCDRRERPDCPLGNGYVRFLNGAFAAAGEQIKVLNRGISGDRVRDLHARWEADCLALQPTLASIAVGINDTWRRYDSGDPTTEEDFEDDYRSLLFPLQVANVAIVLVEPFLLPISDEQRTWREDLDPKIQIVRGLAGEFGATLVPADAFLAAAAEEAGIEAIAPDGVHPTPKGHELLARAWWDAQPQSES